MAGRGGFKEKASFFEVLLSRLEDSVGSMIDEEGVRTCPLLLLVLLVERRWCEFIVPFEMGTLTCGRASSSAEPAIAGEGVEIGFAAAS